MPERQLHVEAPVPVELNHVVMRSAHVSECVDFYSKLLGMRVQAGDGEHAAALSHDGEHHRLLLMAVPPAEKTPGPGIEHIAFKTRTMAELLGNYKRAKELGLKPFMQVHHGGTLSAYYLDPDGVQIEIFIDTQPTDTSIEMMNSPEFAKNPIGAPIDFDDLVERFEAGEPVASLYEQPQLKDGDLHALLEKVIEARGHQLNEQAAPQA